MSDSVQIFNATSVEEAIQIIETYKGEVNQFQLRIHCSMLGVQEVDGSKVSGLFMAMITDKILQRGWWPDGFSDHGEHRIYKYQGS